MFSNFTKLYIFKAYNVMIDICVYCEVITTIKLIIIPITSPTYELCVRGEHLCSTGSANL